MKKELPDTGTYPPEHLNVSQMNRVMRHRLRNLCCGMKMALDRIAEQTQTTHPGIGDSCAVMEAELKNLLRFTQRMDLLFDTLPETESLTLFQLITNLRQFFAEKFPFGNIDLDGPQHEAVLKHGSLVQIAAEELLANAGEACFDETVKLTWQVNGELTIVVSNPCDEPLDPAPATPPQPFFTTRGRHDGLGLAIARRVCDALDGELSFTQDDDHTVITTLKFPADCMS